MYRPNLQEYSVKAPGKLGWWRGRSAAAGAAAVLLFLAGTAGTLAQPDASSGTAVPLNVGNRRPEQTSSPPPAPAGAIPKAVPVRPTTPAPDSRRGLRSNQIPAPRAPRIIQILPDSEKPPAPRATSPEPRIKNPPVVSAPASGQGQGNGTRPAPRNTGRGQSFLGLPISLPRLPTRSRDRDHDRDRGAALPSAPAATAAITAPRPAPAASAPSENRNLLPDRDLPDSLTSPALSNLPRLGDTEAPPPAPPPASSKPVETAAKPAKDEPLDAVRHTLEGKPAEDSAIAGRVTRASRLAELISKSGLDQHEVDLVLLHLSTGDELFQRGSFGSAAEAYESALEYLDREKGAQLRMELQLRRGVVLAELGRPSAEGGDRQVLEEALGLLQGARDFWTKTKNDTERVAMAETNLGITYGYVGDLERGGAARTDALRRSLNSFLAASQMIGGSKEKSMAWAQSQRNLGITFRKLALAGDEPNANFTKSLDCLRTALPVYEKRASTETWARTAGLVAGVILDQARGGDEVAMRGPLVEEALALQRRVVAECAERRFEVQRARAQADLGNLLLIIAGNADLLAVYPQAAKEAIEALDPGPDTMEGAGIPEQRNLARAALHAANTEPDPGRKLELLRMAEGALRQAKDGVSRQDDPALFVSLHFQLGETLGAKLPLVEPRELPPLLQQCLGAFTVAQEALPKREMNPEWTAIEVAKARQLLRFAGHIGGDSRRTAIKRAHEVLEKSRNQWMKEFGLTEQADCFRLLAQARMALSLVEVTSDLEAVAEDLEGIGNQLLAILRAARALDNVETEPVEDVIFSALEQMEDFAYQQEGTRAQTLLRMVIQVWTGLAKAEKQARDRTPDQDVYRIRQAAVVRETLGTAYFYLGYFSPEPSAVDDLASATDCFLQAEAGWKRVPGLSEGQLLKALLPLQLQRVGAITESGRRALGPLRGARLEAARAQAEASLQICEKSRKALGDDGVWLEFRRQFLCARGDAERELALLTNAPEALARLGETRGLLEEMRDSIDRDSAPLAWVEVTNCVGAIYTVQGRLTNSPREKRQLLAQGVARHHQIMQEEQDRLSAEHLRGTRLALAEALALLGPLERAANATEILNFSVSTFQEAAEGVDSSAFPLSTAQARAGWAQALARQRQILPPEAGEAKLLEAHLLIAEAMETLNLRNLPEPYLELLYIQAKLHTTDGPGGAIDAAEPPPGVETAEAALRNILGACSPRFYPELWSRAQRLRQKLLLNYAWQPHEALKACDDWLRDHPGDQEVLDRRLQCLFAAGLHELFVSEVQDTAGTRAERDGIEATVSHVLLAIAHGEAGREAQALTEFRAALDVLPKLEKNRAQRYDFAGVRRYILQHGKKLGAAQPAISQALQALEQGDLETARAALATLAG